jgi:hypothetical protein
MDEILALWRTAWRDDPATHEGRFYPFRNVRVLPKPARDIPIWMGGISDAAMERATRLADGYQAIGISVEDARTLVNRIREKTSDESFTVSVRLPWDQNEAAGAHSPSDMYEAAGVQHLLFDPHVQGFHGLPGGGGVDEWIAIAGQLATQLRF